MPGQKGNFFFPNETYSDEWNGPVGRADPKGAAALEETLEPTSTYYRDPWHVL
jgi:hypothetical protein